MSTLLDTTLTDREREAVEFFVERLRADLGEQLLAVWLYGSAARGEQRGPESDVDLIVVTADRRRNEDAVFAASFDAASFDAARSAPEWTPLSPSVWDPERLSDRRRIESFFIQEVDRDKVVLYGSG